MSDLWIYRQWAYTEFNRTHVGHIRILSIVDKFFVTDCIILSYFQNEATV